MQLLSRLKRLEERRSPLARSHDLVARGVPVKDWPLLELEVFCNESPELQRLSDAELEALAN